MSATTTLTTTTLVGSPTAMTNVSTTEICPACRGSGDCRDPSEVQQRILELERHVQELNERAALTGKCAPIPRSLSACPYPEPQQRPSIFTALHRIPNKTNSLTRDSRQTRRLRRRSPPTTLGTRRLHLAPKQLLPTTNIFPRRPCPLTNPSPDPRIPRDFGAYISASAAEPPRDPHLLASLSPQ